MDEPTVVAGPTSMRLIEELVSELKSRVTIVIVTTTCNKRPGSRTCALSS